MCQLFPVSFHGDTIFCVDNSGEPFVPMRPIVENLGMDWARQSTKLNANKVRWNVGMMPTVAQDGKEREMLCLPLRKLPAWLASINPKKVKPELRAKIELYQNECDDALWDYWMNGKAERKENPEPETDVLPALGQMIIQALVRNIADRYQGIDQRSVNMRVWMGLRNHFGIASYKQLPAEKLTEAVTWLANYELKSRKFDRHIGAKENGLNPAMTQSLQDTLIGLEDLRQKCDFYIGHVQGNLQNSVLHYASEEQKRHLFYAIKHMRDTAVDGLYMARNSLIVAWNLGRGVKFV